MRLEEQTKELQEQAKVLKNEIDPRTKMKKKP